MTEPEGNDPLVVERTVAARPETLFRYFQDPARWMQWQGVDAQIEPRPGGIFRLNVTGDGFVSGKFVEVIDNESVTFTWGWEAAGSPVPVGSSSVKIELIPIAEGTLLRLTHSGLPPDTIENHRTGWENYMTRLAAVGEGRDPGPDPLRA